MQQNQSNRQSQTNSRSVFVGNIPYEATEEQIQEIFAQVGPVVSFRLVFDRDTGKPKGYGFVEYRDSQTALSAMRNLNGYEINARALRVYFAEMEKDQNQPGGGGGGGGGGTNMQNDISKVLEGMSNSQLYEIMVQMKGLIQKKPEQAQQLLQNHPHLAYALLNAQVLLGVISPHDAQQLHLAAQQQPGQVNNNNNNMGNSFQIPAFIPQPYMQPQAMPFMPVNLIQQPVNTPNVDIFANLDGDKKELLDQILKLTPEQIESFPPQEQAQMIQLRQAMSAMYRR
jgi:cleavage stimulation factor subunit 2